MPFAATWMHIKTITLSEASQTEEENHHMTSLTRGIQKEMIQMSLQTKHKQIHRLREKLTVAKGGEWGEGTGRELGVDMDTLLYLT